MAKLTHGAGSADRGTQLRLRDDDGDWVTAGDSVRFSYGMPPVTVIAPIIERDGKLIGLCPGHDPAEFELRSLRRQVGAWYKHNMDVCGERSESVARSS